MKFISIYKEDCHKVFNFLGIKLKFLLKEQWLLKHQQLLLEQTNELLNVQSSKINELANNFKLLKSEFDKQKYEFQKQKLGFELALNKQHDTIKGINKNFETEINVHNANTKAIQTQNNKLKLQVEELNFRNVLMETIVNSEWLNSKTFTLRGGAANYSFIFILYMVLDLIKPENILEFGIGQTSLVTTQFAKFYNKDLTIVEHNQEWINIFQKRLNIGSKTKIVHKNLINFLCEGENSDKYDSLDDITKDKKFNLIIIDGPIGVDRKYPRTNILDLIPEYLDENFVIILDDAEREGEKNTANLIFKALEKNNIAYSKSYKTALKTQLLISSKNNDFIHYY